VQLLATRDHVQDVEVQQLVTLRTPVGRLTPGPAAPQGPGEGTRGGDQVRGTRGGDQGRGTRGGDQGRGPGEGDQVRGPGEGTYVILCFFYVNVR